MSSMADDALVAAADEIYDAVAELVRGRLPTANPAD